MKRAAVFFVLAVLGMTCWAQASGSLAIICPEGFQVFLDGHSIGSTTKEESGKIVETLGLGDHTVVIKRDGYEDQSFTITIKRGETAVVKADPAQTSYKMNQLDQGAVTIERSVGDMVIRSLPTLRKGSIDGKVNFTTDCEIKEYAAGPHRLSFTDGTRTLNADINLAKSDTLNILVNFLNGKITVTSMREEDRKARAQAAEEAAAKKKAEDDEKAKAKIISDAEAERERIANLYKSNVNTYEIYAIFPKKNESQADSARPVEFAPKDRPGKSNPSPLKIYDKSGGEHALSITCDYSGQYDYNFGNMVRDSFSRRHSISTWSYDLSLTFRFSRDGVEIAQVRREGRFSFQSYEAQRDNGSYWIPTFTYTVNPPDAKSQVDRQQFTETITIGDSTIIIAPYVGKDFGNGNPSPWFFRLIATVANNG